MAATILLSPPPEAEVLAIAREQLPSGFDLQVVEARELPSRLGEADYLLGFIGPLADDAFGASPRVKLVQLLSAGYDNFNLEAARRARIPLATNGGANAISVAEHTVLLILSTLRHLVELDRQVHSGQWRTGSSKFRVHELWSLTVGIVGMGRIGQQLAKRLRGWDATVVYFDPRQLDADQERELGVRSLPLDELLAVSDVVSVHVPLSEATHHLIDGDALELMKPSAVLINTARGGLVDEVALAEALRAGRLAGAGLDVFSQEPPPADHPLFGIPNAILTPHAAGPTWESWPRRYENGYANICRVDRGEPAAWVVPELMDLFPDSPNV